MCKLIVMNDVTAQFIDRKLESEKFKSKYFQTLNHIVTHQINVPLDQSILHAQKLIISPQMNLSLKPLIMKIIIGQKMAKLMSNDLLDHHSMERNKFKKNYETCNLYSIIKEVLYILTEQANRK